MLLNIINSHHMFYVIGVPVENASVTVNTTLLLLSTGVQLTVIWEQGTDIEYTVTYGDGTLDSWDWLSNGHSESYGELTTYTTHTYAKHGNYTIMVNITNELGFNISTLKLVVEAKLEDVIMFVISSNPYPTPNPINVTVMCCHLCKF